MNSIKAKELIKYEIDKKEYLDRLCQLPLKDAEIKFCEYEELKYGDNLTGFYKKMDELRIEKKKLFEIGELLWFIILGVIFVSINMSNVIIIYMILKSIIKLASFASKMKMQDGIITYWFEKIKLRIL